MELEPYCVRVAVLLDVKCRQTLQLVQQEVEKSQEEENDT